MSELRPTLPSNGLNSLIDEKDFLRLVLDHVSDCVVVVDLDGCVSYINKPYCRLLGGDPADFVGQHVTEVVSPDTHLHLVAQTGDPVVGPLIVRGHELYTKQVPVSREGRVIGAVGLALFADRQEAAKFAKNLSTSDFRIGNETSRWSTHYHIQDIIGSCQSIERVKNQIRKAAALDVNVLIQGETGTGKELAASAIHNLSSKSKKPFVAVNCATIPDDLIESELFGYEGGAFTGARSRGSLGKFELANHGTIFLDEIGDLPLRSQAALLRVLQEGQILRVGGIHPIKLELKVICATHRNLLQMVEMGEFREDLYYRLDVMRVEMPALRERTDLKELVEHILEKIRLQFGFNELKITPEITRDLEQREWRGNIRELRNVLERAAINLAEGKTLIESLTPESGIPPGRVHNRLSHGLASAVAEAERKIILQALNEAGGNRSEAARQLRIDRATLYNKLEKLGLKES